MTSSRASLCFLASCLLLTASNAAAPPMRELAPKDKGTSTGVAPLMTGENGWTTSALFTIGDTLPNGHIPDKTPDGIGAWSRGKTVRVVFNHEIGSTSGLPYKINGGFSLKGARMTALDVDAKTRKVLSGSVAYDTVYGPDGTYWKPSGTQPVEGFQRFCSAVGIKAGDNGIEDDILFAGEESSNNHGGLGGYAVALDVDAKALHIVPAMGHASYESATPMGNFGSNKVIILIGDDQTSALKIFIGEKGRPGRTGSSQADFLKDNGLAYGQLYAWKATSVTCADYACWPSENGQKTGTSLSGTFFKVDNTCVVGPTTGAVCDPLGYPASSVVQSRAKTGGAFMFTRIEDVATDPYNSARAIYAVTAGSDTNPYGQTMMVDIGALADQINNNLEDINEFAATVKIVHDGNDSSGKSVRSPDNVAWAHDGSIFMMEDRATPASVPFCSEGNGESAIWTLPSVDGTGPTSPQVVARMNRNAFQAGNPDECGAWESTGGIEVSDVFGASIAQGTQLVLLSVQAHDVDERGQLLFIERKQNGKM